MIKTHQVEIVVTALKTYNVSSYSTGFSFFKLKTTSVALSLPWTNIKLINTGNQDMQRKP